MGFGHRVYKNYDPRAKLMAKVCKEVLESEGVTDCPELAIAQRLEQARNSAAQFGRAPPPRNSAAQFVCAIL